MGLFLSRSSPEWQVVCPSSVSLFDLEARFFVPTRGSRTSSRAEAVKVGRRANFAACSELARPYLDSFEHDGTLGAIGMTIEGSPLIGRADQSRHNLVSGGSKDPNHDAVIRIGSEAPKRRAHSPFRHGRPRKHVGTPPPRTVIGDPSPGRTGPRLLSVFSDSSSLCRPEDHAVGHHPFPRETPQSDQ